jgi:integrase
MPARRLQIGEHGSVAYVTGPTGRVTASMYYRNGQGRRRRIEATADSKTAAHREAVKAFERAMAAAGGVSFSSRTTFRDLAAEWFERFEQLVRDGRRSPASASLYRATLDRHVLPVIGEVRLAELTTARVDALPHRVLRDKGHATAKVCRSVLSGVCGLAVRRDALRSNPVRDVGDLERGDRAGARALTLSECREWLAVLDADPYAVRKDLPDLARFLLGTGVRIGEAMGVTWDDVDLVNHLVHIRRTVIRVKGVGLVPKVTRSRAGLRTLRIPAWLVAVLAARRPEDGGPVPVFPDAAGGFRDRNNIERDFRLVRQGTRFEWVVPHTYRKTVATFLDGGGLSARVVADQLGHARISMTQDVYMGRKAVDSAAASALEGLTE